MSLKCVSDTVVGSVTLDDSPVDRIDKIPDKRRLQIVGVSALAGADFDGNAVAVGRSAERLVDSDQCVGGNLPCHVDG